MNAIHRTRIYTRRVFCPDTGLGNNVCHKRPLSCLYLKLLLSSRLSKPKEDVRWCTTKVRLEAWCDWEPGVRSFCSFSSPRDQLLGRPPVLSTCRQTPTSRGPQNSAGII